MNRFYKLPHSITAREDLKASDKLLFAVICDFIGPNTAGWPGKNCLMRRTGLSGKTVCDSIRKLEAVGLLKVERGGRGRSNFYRIGGAGIEPEQEKNQFRNYTTSGPETTPLRGKKWTKNYARGGVETKPEVVQNLHPIKTDLLNQRDNTPETKSKIDFQEAKEKTELPVDFLTWFETEVLTRWDKCPVSPATLDDWYSLHKTFGKEIITAAIQQHRQDTPRKQWTPELAAVKSIARKIRGPIDSRSPRQEKQIERACDIDSHLDEDKTIGEQHGTFKDYMAKCGVTCT